MDAMLDTMADRAPWACDTRFRWDEPGDGDGRACGEPMRSPACGCEEETPWRFPRFSIVSSIVR